MANGVIGLRGDHAQRAAAEAQRRDHVPVTIRPHKHNGKSCSGGSSSSTSCNTHSCAGKQIIANNVDNM